MLPRKGRLAVDDETEVVVEVTPANSAVDEEGGVFADGLEHEEAAVVPRLQEALVDERVEGVEVGAADGLRTRRSEAAREDTQPGEVSLVVLVEQLVAPLDGRAQRPLPLVEVAPARCEQRQPLLEALKQLLHRRDLDACGRELERQR